VPTISFTEKFIDSVSFSSRDVSSSLVYDIVFNQVDFSYTLGTQALRNVTSM